MTSKYEELQKLNKLFTEGIITEEEYVKEKSKLLDNEQRQQSNQTDDQNGYNMLMHLSQFSNYLLPLLGLIVPIIMWTTRKNESQSVNINGKIILNWKISLFLYSIVSIILFIIIGGISVFSFIPWSDSSMHNDFPIGSFTGILGSIAILLIPFIIFAVLDFIFTIIGAIKANNNEIWNYPLSIRFFNTQH